MSDSNNEIVFPGGKRCWIDSYNRKQDLKNLLAQLFPYEILNDLMLKISNRVMILANSAKKRNKRKKCLQEITREDVLDIYLQQRGVCCYNENIILSLDYDNKFNNNHKMSIERLNQNFGYSVDNVGLCCLQYNGSWQMSKEFLQLLANADKKIQECVSIEKIFIEPPPIVLPKKKRRKSIDGRVFCNDCEQILPLKDFSTDNRGAGQCRTRCKTCQNRYNGERRKLPNVFVDELLDSCHRRSSAREKIVKNPKKRPIIDRLKFGITIDRNWIIEQYGIQNGRCFYSAYPLVLEKKSPFAMSIERVDDRLDYTKENCVLVAQVMQVGGGVKWTRELFLEDHIHLQIKD